MSCPNCRKPFVVEQDGKSQCFDCGWFENVDGEWKVCEAPEPEQSGSQNLTSNSSGSQTPEPPPAALEPDPAALEPDPASLEPDPALQEPSPEPARRVKKYLGGLLTVTEVDE